MTFGVAALASSVLALAPVASATPGPSQPSRCYNGVAPFNPYVDNCAIPSRPPHILGAAPDQTAILNCGVGSKVLKAVCLSQYVNGGPYPGIALGVG
ncbi:hypothetical protein [Mycobacterium sp. EPa45]|uniref:hypothetical protein n=1 Tax=Mycobacterium sp. EPa45 TaxID=1545728 RepID=UPI00069A77B6|nr:hypothetical protein [Mycobacterium sp. EPa45]